MSAPVQVGPSPSGGGPVPPSGDDWDELLADFGDRVRAARQARQWTQTELARRAGVHLRTVQGIEGACASYLPLFIRVCAALGILDTVLTDRWEMPKVRPYLSPQQARVLEAVADGRPLTQAAGELAMTRGGVASVLTSTYRRLGVGHVRRGERRQAAVRVAVQYGLITPPNRTS